MSKKDTENHSDQSNSGAGPADPAAMAKEFLDLWQNQVISSIDDPGFAQGMSQLMSSFWGDGRNTGAGPFNGGMPFPAYSAGQTAGAAPAAHAHGDGQPDLDGLLTRLDQCEARIASLEAELAELRGRPKGKA